MSSTLEKLNHYLEQELAPLAQKLDSDPILLQEAFEHLKQMGCLSYFLPKEYGGEGFERKEFISFYQAISRHSGVLSFLQSQHQVAMIYLQNIQECPETKKILHDVVDNQKALAYCSVVRQDSLQLELRDGKYYIDGFLPWVTGKGIYDEILLVFSYKGIIRVCIIPFHDFKSNQGEISCGKVHDLVVFKASNTVSIQIKQLEIHPDNLYTIDDVTKKHLLKEHPTIYSFAAVSEVLLEEVKNCSRFELNHVQQVYHQLHKKLQAYSKGLEQNIEQPLLYRAQGYHLASECAQFARLTIGGKSLMMGHPVQRISREIWSFSMAGLYQDQQEAYFQYLWSIDKQTS